MDTPSLSLANLLERLGHMMRAELRQAGGASGLQPVHLQALLYLSQANRYSNTPQALTEYLGLTKGTVSQSLIVLARKGLIERVEDARDRRVVRLSLTAEGAALLDDAALMGDWPLALRNISAPRLKAATQVMQEALRSLQVRRGDRSFGICRACAYNQQVGLRSFLCGLSGEKLSGPETRQICREHVPAK
jgi:DNA-binding MarR family transcriptional regulator